jgi:mono/diheme cytochrome c family protein
LGAVVADTAAATGKKVYQKRCQACHGADGTGNPQMAQALQVTIPPVNGVGLEKKSDAEYLRVIAEGQGKMPGYAKQLSAEEQQQVLEYMKTLGR